MTLSRENLKCRFLVGNLSNRQRTVNVENNHWAEDLCRTQTVLCGSINESNKLAISLMHLPCSTSHSENSIGRRARTAIFSSVAQIRPRATHTRPLQPKHVADLTESIAALGLIEPLVVDNHRVLLAGCHRLATIQTLNEKKPQIYDNHFHNNLVPVRIIPFDSTADSERALKVELAGNEKRINYSQEQIKQLAERLRELNYRDTPGRSKVGEKALGPALAVAIGVSNRYVRKVLRESKGEETGKKIGTQILFFSASNYFGRLKLH